MLCISVCVRERGRERETEKDTSLHVTCPGNARDEAQKTLSLARARASERARRSTEHTHTYTNTHTTCVFEPVSFGISAHSKRVLRQLVLLPLKTLPFGCQQTLQALSLHLAFQPIPHPMHAIQSNVLLNKRLRPLRSKSYIVSQTRMRPTTGSSVGYPEEEAFDDTEDYHDKRHADGVNTLQAQQDLSDILYKVIARACGERAERERERETTLRYCFWRASLVFSYYRMFSYARIVNSRGERPFCCWELP
jgi:hypothetical protein